MRMSMRSECDESMKEKKMREAKAKRECENALMLWVREKRVRMRKTTQQNTHRKRSKSERKGPDAL